MQRGIAGIGWPISKKPQDLAEYIELASSEFKSSVSSISFAVNPKIDDLFWARDPSGVYYLGKINGTWSYSDHPDDLELDIPNQIPCSWMKVGNEENVPGKIIACFRPRRTFQAIRDEKMEDFSKWLYNKLSKENYYEIEMDSFHNMNSDTFFKMISSDDCEDIVGLYLQIQENYCLIPSTCKSDTTGYEFILKHRQTKKTAAAQVKQGLINLDDTLSHSADTIYLFSTLGQVSFEKDNIIPLDKEELYHFILSNKDLLPNKILYWFNL